MSTKLDLTDQAIAKRNADLVLALTASECPFKLEGDALVPVIPILAILRSYNPREDPGGSWAVSLLTRTTVALETLVRASTAETRIAKLREEIENLEGHRRRMAAEQAEGSEPNVDETWKLLVSSEGS